MPIKFFINNVQYDDPVNWQEFTIRLVRDKTVNAVILNYDVNLILSGRAYAMLNQLRLDNTFCQPLNVLIQYQCGRQWYNLVRGYIYVTETRFELSKCQCSTKVFDDTFSSYINTNKNVPFVTNAAFTKELVAMTPLVDTRIQTFDPKTNAGVRSSWGYKVNDLLEKLVEFISNGQVRYKSNYFSNPGNVGYNIIVSCGLAMRSETITPFTITFFQLYEALKSKFNLGMGFQLIDGIPHVLIEPEDSFFDATVSTTVELVDNVEAYYDENLLFNRVQFGSSNSLGQFDSVVDNNYLSFPEIPFRGFQDETFYVLGECNIDSVLDAYNETPIIIDSNIIEDVVVYGNDSYDKNPFLIQSQNTDDPSCIARRTDPLGLGQNVYNGGLTNDASAARFIGAVPNSIYSSYLGYPTADLEFTAESAIAFPDDNCPGFAGTEFLFDLSEASDANPATPALLSEREGTFMPYETIVSNPGGNYDGTLYQYTVPAPGRFVFRSRITVLKCPSAPVGQIAFLRIVLTIIDPEGVNTLQTILSPITSYFVNYVSGDPFIQLDYTFPEIILGFGFKVRIDVQGRKQIAIDGCPVLIKNTGNVYIPTGAQYFTDFTTLEYEAVEGGELEAFDPTDYKRNGYAFKYPLSFAQVKAIIENPFKQIRFTYGFNQIHSNNGFISTVIISELDKFDTEFNLISNQ